MPREENVVAEGGGVIDGAGADAGIGFTGFCAVWCPGFWMRDGAV